MNSHDASLLTEMMAAISSFKSGSAQVGELADHLLALHDGLDWQDHRWDRELTQHIATLDSASTFTPEDEEQSHQMALAITVAVDNLTRLIQERGAKREQ
jgi:hypothetical protein